MRKPLNLPAVPSVDTTDSKALGGNRSVQPRADSRRTKKLQQNISEYPEEVGESLTSNHESVALIREMLHEDSTVNSPIVMRHSYAYANRISTKDRNTTSSFSIRSDHLEEEEGKSKPIEREREQKNVFVLSTVFVLELDEEIGFVC